MSYQLLVVLLPVTIIAPAYVALRLLYRWHPAHRPPPRRVLQVYLLGFATSLPAALLEVLLLVALVPLAGETQLSPLWLAVLAAGIGLIEEGMKRAFLHHWVIKQGAVHTPYDAIVYAVAIGLGFATVENRGYIFGSAALGASGPLLLAIGLRLLLPTPAHALWGVIMGDAAGRAALTSDEARRRRLWRQAWLLPAVWHGLYDFFILLAMRADGTVALTLWAALGVTMLAMWVVGMMMLRRARGAPAEPVTPAGSMAQSEPAPAEVRAVEADLSVWARPRAPAGGQ